MALLVKSPYDQTDGRWLRGNMHAHTTMSDGARTPQELVNGYVRRGYDWLCITDHDMVTPPPESIPDHFLVITGNEITANGPHILHVGTDTALEPLPDRALVIENVAQAKGICVLNHPNWEKNFAHWPQDKMEAMPGKFHGIEIYNGVCHRLEGTPLATDRWDQLLSKGIPIWGYGNDDTHIDQDFGNAWNRVSCDRLDRESILKGLAEGRFYVSTGVEFSTLQTSGSSIRIVSRNGSLCIPVMDWGIELGRFPGRAWEFDLEKLAGGSRPTYLRFEVHGDGAAMAWTQPLYMQWT
jgi:hypothetical protein